MYIAQYLLLHIMYILFSYYVHTILINFASHIQLHMYCIYYSLIILILNTKMCLGELINPLAKHLRFQHSFSAQIQLMQVSPQHWLWLDYLKQSYSS